MNVNSKAMWLAARKILESVREIPDVMPNEARSEFLNLKQRRLTEATVSGETVRLYAIAQLTSPLTEIRDNSSRIKKSIPK